LGQTYSRVTNPLSEWPKPLARIARIARIAERERILFPCKIDVAKRRNGSRLDLPAVRGEQ
jgi:hypothetical protein